MTAADDARAVVVVADYIGTDAAGKINALGLGFAMMGTMPPVGATAPMYVGAIIEFPGKYAGQEFAMSLDLRDESTGSAAMVPAPGSPIGPEAPLQPLRIQQMMKIDRPNVPGVILPSDMPCRVQAVVGFPTGLPLQAGRHYAWRLEIDGRHLKGWEARFYVIGPPPGPVFGGPATSPTDIGPMPQV